MTSITPGTGGTLKSVSAEAALVELAVFLRKNEGISANNPSNRNYVSIDFSGSSSIANISYNIPVVSTIDTQGRLLVTASEYLQNLNFSAGTGGTFKSENAAQTLIEITSYIQAKESDITTNPNDKNFVTGNFNADDGVMSGTAAVPIAFSLDNSGKPIIEIVTYLL